MFEDFFQNLCKKIGEDPQREGLKFTPKRLEECYKELLSGYQKSPKNQFLSTFCEIPHKEIIVIKDIEFYSLCEHHLLPFFGKISIGYIPQEKIAGISDFAKLVALFSRRLQTQENLTFQIIESIMQELNPKGAILLCEAMHLCMAMRGAEKQSATLVTFTTRGIFEEDPSRQSEFWNLLK